MYSVAVSLMNADGLRLCLFVDVNSRTTANANDACIKAERMADDDVMHKKYGPWHAVSTTYNC